MNMNKFSKKVLLDTNIWVDYYLGRPSGEASRKAMKLLLLSDWQVSAAVVSTQDTFYLIKAYLKNETRKAGQQEITDSQGSSIDEIAWKSLEHMASVAHLVGADVAECKRAIKLRSLHFDYEDNLIVASAEAAGIDLLITRDKKLQKNSPIKTLSPEALCDELEKDIF